MAIYRFEAKVISRNGGRSTVASASYRTGKCATSAAAYRAGAQLTDERTGQTYDYTSKRGVLGAEIIAPEGAPAWMRDRTALWNAVEKIERRKDSQLARDFVLSLPHELTQEQRAELTRDFVRGQFADRGYVADVAWHAPSKAEGLNYHAHVMVPMRKVEGDGFARVKERAEGDEHPAFAWKRELMRLREAWADTANKHLEAAGLDVRLDHRSLSERGIDRVPEPKQGPVATQIEEQGRESLAGNDRRRVKEENMLREQLKLEHAELTDKIVFLEAERIRKRPMQPLHEEDFEQQQAREQERIRQLREQDDRIQAFKQQVEREAEEAQRKERENREQAEKQRENGFVADAGTRYTIALGHCYNIKDPYTTLAQAAAEEGAAFKKEQEALRHAALLEADDAARAQIELRAQIEAHEYMAITSQRLAGVGATIAGRNDHPDVLRDQERAVAYQEQADELRQQYEANIAARRQQEAGPSADTPAQPGETTVSRSTASNSAGDDSASGDSDGSKERTDNVEMTDAKAAKLAAVRAENAAAGQAREQRQQDRAEGRGGGGAGR